jgi:hypothetical protein
MVFLVKSQNQEDIMAERKRKPAGSAPAKKTEDMPDSSARQSPQEKETGRLQELQAVARAAATLAKNKDAFTEAVNAYRAKDAGRFQAALDRAGVGEQCERICFFLCEKVCIGICLRFCPEPQKAPVDVAEMMAFAEALNRLLQDENALQRLVEIFDKEDVQAWNAFIKEHELNRFCYQLCRFFCDWRCKEICIDLCPPKPLITRVGSIPIAQIGPNGLGNGPSIPPFHVGPPNPPAGYGDHPFGASVWLMGVFNMPTATQYRVEVSSTGPGGPYTPLLVTSVQGYNRIMVFPFEIPCTRFPSGGVDPGWFNVADICDSDGGPTAAGEKTLLYWPTSSLPDGIYYLRLQVRDGINTRVSSPQVVQLDNTGPFPLPRPTISLELQKPDGTKEPLKCGKVHKGDGLIAVTIHAYDPNYSSVNVTARGNSGLSVPVVDTSATPLSKTYNGNLADTGYPVPTTFLWDPWSDPRIVPCCYVVYVEINDRAILNDSYSGGHYNAGWEAIEIGF